MDINQWTVGYVRNQCLELEEKFKKKLRSWGIKDSELEDSIKVTLHEETDGYFLIRVSFNTYGRFVDMGSGRGYSHGKKLNSRANFAQVIEKKRSRRVKKWYSRTLFGWIHNLENVIMVRHVKEVSTYAEITLSPINHIPKS